MFEYLKSAAKSVCFGSVGMFFIYYIMPYYETFYKWMNVTNSINKFCFIISFGWIFYAVIFMFYKMNYFIDIIIESFCVRKE